MLGTVEANEILLQASKLPQQCFDIHLTPREENAKGKRSSTSMAQTANQAKDGREARKEEKLRMETLSRNQKQTLCFALWFVMGPWLHQIPFLPFCVIFLPSSKMHAFVLPVQWQALGFLHSGVLITGSHVSCSHLFPPLPHLFIFSPLISSISPL